MHSQSISTPRMCAPQSEPAADERRRCCGLQDRQIAIPGQQPRRSLSPGPPPRRPQNLWQQPLSSTLHPLTIIGPFLSPYSAQRTTGRYIGVVRRGALPQTCDGPLPAMARQMEYRRPAATTGTSRSGLATVRGWSRTACWNCWGAAISGMGRRKSLPHSLRWLKTPKSRRINSSGRPSPHT
jgi:hypothetical protein